ncbi:MAG: hypothetical protein WDO16_11780 [Bacteroidota bacterium]
MTDIQTTVSPTPSYPPANKGIFGTKIPSSVCFVIGVLLFTMPFAELKCNPPEEKGGSLFNLGNMSMSFTNTGFGLAVGSDWKMNMPGMGGLFGDKKTDDWKKDIKPQEPNTYAIVALLLAILGLGLSFVNARPGAAVNILTGVLSSAALIGLMIDLKTKSKDIISDIQKTGNNFDAGEYTNLTLSFTPWFYVSVIAFLAAAFFSYKRMQSLKGTS